MEHEYEMVKPTAAALAQAVEAAELMRERTDDETGVAHSLLYLFQRNRRLEEVVALVDRYLNFGTPKDEHAQLVLMLEALHQSDHEPKLPRS
ncbi:MAG: hypothetical protein L3J28_08955 [Candidatus Polarisedimenticolaceae bacterium]|nr:hypothetical protein [Candidatus Polarisedimenticolaceae bacterium]